MLWGAYGGQVEWITRSAPSLCVHVRWKFIYLSEDPKRKVISRRSAGPFSRDGSETAAAGNIGQGIMIFAEGAIKSKMYADTPGGYSYRILGTAAWNKILFYDKYNEGLARKSIRLYNEHILHL